MNRAFRWMLCSATLAGVMHVTGGDAAACGGLFCSAANPVNQAAERIIFMQEGSRTTAVIEIQYQGPSDRFAWVLPVPGVPEIGVSSKQALDRLQQLTNPRYNLTTTRECEIDFDNGAAGDGDTAGDGDAESPGVSVVASGTVGPYDFNVISVSENANNPAELALEWLANNDYDVSLLGEDILGSYLEQGLNLAAFRLTKNSDSGSIRPVLISYDSDQPVIPIRPTAVAANPDMGILVWVLGPGRAVPINYRSLVINDTLINWFNPNSNYNDVVIAAADEAGGQGFVTELATGGPDGDNVYANSILAPEERQFRDDLEGLELQGLLLQASLYFGTWDGYREVLEQSVTLRDGYTIDEFLGCVDCYFQGPDGGLTPSSGSEGNGSGDAGSSAAADGGAAVLDDGGLATPYSDPILATDPEEFLMLLDSLVIEPMSTTAALFPGNAVTRLYTTMSADEMTEDPAFDFNASLGPISNIHTADRYLYCDDRWVITLPSGITLAGEGQTWPVSTTDGLPYNLQVVQDDVEGPGAVITDNFALISDALGDLGVLGEPVAAASPDAGFPDAGTAGITYVNDNGCGCRIVGLRRNATGSVALTGLALLALLRRRRNTSLKPRRGEAL